MGKAVATEGIPSSTESVTGMAPHREHNSAFVQEGKVRTSVS